MQACETIKSCDFASCKNYEGVLVSFGVCHYGSIRYAVICARDNLVLCQHVLIRCDRALALIEKMARVLLNVASF